MAASAYGKAASALAASEERLRSEAVRLNELSAEVKGDLAGLADLHVGQRTRSRSLVPGRWMRLSDVMSQMASTCSAKVSWPLHRIMNVEDLSVMSMDLGNKCLVAGLIVKDNVDSHGTRTFCLELDSTERLAKAALKAMPPGDTLERYLVDMLRYIAKD